MNSTILSKKGSYLTQLLSFLSPAVGNDSHWVLCYRASSDGWDANTFHSRCDGKKNTVTIVEKGNYVFGGYTDTPWGRWNCFICTVNSHLEDTPLLQILAIADKIQILIYKGLTENDSRYYGLSLLRTQNVPKVSPITRFDCICISVFVF